MLVPEQDSKSAGRVSTLSNACCVRRAPRQSIIDGECNDVCIRYRGLAGALLKPVVAPESRPYRRLITSTCPGRSRLFPKILAGPAWIKAGPNQRNSIFAFSSSERVESTLCSPSFTWLPASGSAREQAARPARAGPWMLSHFWQHHVFCIYAVCG